MSPGEQPVRRRELLLAAVGATSAQASDDEGVVADLLALEQVAVASYDAALAAPRGRPLTGRFAATLRRFRDQEEQHAEVLASTLDGLGGRAPAPPAGAAALAQARAAAGLEHGLERLETPAEVGRFAIELENAQIARYLAAIRELVDARLLQLAAQAMAAEGQHAAVLRGLLSDDVGIVVPGAFERGVATFP